MTRLDESQYNKARQFLLKHGRKLEAALFAYEFEHGDPSEVYRQLATYQNADGGFGHGLEPDLRCKASSALATTTALQILTGMNERNTEMIKRAMQYFVRSYEERRNGWDIIPKEAEEAPRAFWWNYGAFDNHWGNPNAEIIGYLNQFPSSLSPELVSQLNTYAFYHLYKSCDLKEMHEMQCYLRWVETLSEDVVNQVSGKLDEFVDNCIIRNPEEREGYSGYPLLIVKSPESRYYSKYEDVLPGDLDRLIDVQGEDGSWVPNWAWGRFDDEWENAKVEWQGILTINALRTLRDFGRFG